MFIFRSERWLWCLRVVSIVCFLPLSALAQEMLLGPYADERSYIDLRFANSIDISISDVVGLIRGVELVLNDEVDDGCWTNVGDVKSRLRAELERSNVPVYLEPLAAQNPFVPDFYVNVLGFKIENGVCVVSISASIEYGAYADYGSLTYTKKVISITAKNTVWERRSVLSGGPTLNEYIMSWAQATVDTLIADIAEARRKPNVSSALSIWPERPVITRKEMEQELDESKR